MEKSSTSAVVPASQRAEPVLDQLAQAWAYLDPAVRQELEAQAKTSGALVRRREIKNVWDLLRLVLAYALFPWSLKLLGAWCHLVGLGHLSDVAILKRLRKSRLWLGQVLVQLLRQRQVALPTHPGVRIRLLDATVVKSPGRSRARWYVHTSFDLGSLALTDLRLTDHHSAESLAHFTAQPGEIGIADRGYAYAKSLGAWLATGAQLIVRAHWQNLSLCEADGSRVDVLAWLRTLPPDAAAAPSERPVQLATPDGTFKLRLIAAALPTAAQRRAAQRVRDNAKHKGRQPTLDNVYAAGFIVVLTNLPATWAARQVLELYQVRWQVELVFKRLKGVFCLANLRGTDPDLAQTFLLGNLIAALLVDQLLHGVRRQVAAWFTDRRHPLSLKRVIQLLLDQLRQSIRGPLDAATIQAELPNLQRYLCDSPRRRIPQWMAAQVFLQNLSTC